MADKVPQNFENHGRILPAYHLVAFPLFALNFLWALYNMVVGPSWASLFGVLLAVALVLLFALSRMMVVTVQDRVIRLEMRLRMREILPAALKSRINEFTPKQLVALRFAGDAELPVLAQKVLDENLHDQKAIKRMVKDWQADYLRA